MYVLLACFCSAGRHLLSMWLAAQCAGCVVLVAGVLVQCKAALVEHVRAAPGLPLH